MNFINDNYQICPLSHRKPLTTGFVANDGCRLVKWISVLFGFKFLVQWFSVVEWHLAKPGLVSSLQVLVGQVAQLSTEHFLSLSCAPTN